MERSMKASVLIMIQETHGGRQQLEVMVASSPYNYKVFRSRAEESSQYSSELPDAERAGNAQRGGVAFLVPWLTSDADTR
eukprot:2194847-Pyramimonas_sp.AAC.1